MPGASRSAEPSARKSPGAVVLPATKRGGSPLHAARLLIFRKLAEIGR
jgi:hypothetical protein